VPWAKKIIHRPINCSRNAHQTCFSFKKLFISNVNIEENLSNAYTPNLSKNDHRQIKRTPNLIIFCPRQIKCSPNLIFFISSKNKCAPNMLYRRKSPHHQIKYTPNLSKNDHRQNKCTPNLIFFALAKKSIWSIAKCSPQFVRIRYSKATLMSKKTSSESPKYEWQSFFWCYLLTKTWTKVRRITTGYDHRIRRWLWTGFWSLARTTVLVNWLFKNYSFMISSLSN